MPIQRREGIGNALSKEIIHIGADLTPVLLPIPTRPFCQIEKSLSPSQCRPDINVLRMRKCEEKTQYY